MDEARRRHDGEEKSLFDEEEGEDSGNPSVSKTESVMAEAGSAPISQETSDAAPSTPSKGEDGGKGKQRKPRTPQPRNPLDIPRGAFFLHDTRHGEGEGGDQSQAQPSHQQRQQHQPAEETHKRSTASPKSFKSAPRSRTPELDKWSHDKFQDVEAPHPSTSTSATQLRDGDETARGRGRGRGRGAGRGASAATGSPSYRNRNERTASESTSEAGGSKSAVTPVVDIPSPALAPAPAPAPMAVATVTNPASRGRRSEHPRRGGAWQHDDRNEPRVRGSSQQTHEFDNRAHRVDRDDRQRSEYRGGFRGSRGGSSESRGGRGGSTELRGGRGGGSESRGGRSGKFVFVNDLKSTGSIEDIQANSGPIIPHDVHDSPQHYEDLAVAARAAVASTSQQSYALPKKPDAGTQAQLLQQQQAQQLQQLQQQQLQQQQQQQQLHLLQQQLYMAQQSKLLQEAAAASGANGGLAGSAASGTAPVSGGASLSTVAGDASTTGGATGSSGAKRYSSQRPSAPSANIYAPAFNPNAFDFNSVPYMPPAAPPINPYAMPPYLNTGYVDPNLFAMLQQLAINQQQLAQPAPFYGGPAAQGTVYYQPPVLPLQPQYDSPARSSPTPRRSQAIQITSPQQNSQQQQQQQQQQQSSQK